MPARSGLPPVPGPGQATSCAHGLPRVARSWPPHQYRGLHPFAAKNAAFVPGGGSDSTSSKLRPPGSVQVQVPQNLGPGSYALSFRYDCEQTSQVWQNW